MQVATVRLLLLQLVLSFLCLPRIQGHPEETDSTVRKLLNRGAYCTKWNSIPCGQKSIMPKNVSSLYFWYPVGWESCNGNPAGVKRARFGCFDRHMTTVDISNCLHLDLPNISKLCTKDSALTYKVHALPWSECSKPCGQGYQMRKKLCVDSLGNIAMASKCQITGDLFEIRDCFLQSCNLSYWLQSSWSHCGNSCGGSKRLRNITCVNQGPGLNPCPNQQFEVEKLCNSQPCQDYTWLIGPWNISLSSSRQYSKRLVECVDGHGEPVNATYCHSLKPSSEASYLIKNASGCMSSECLINATCQGDARNCFDGTELGSLGLCDAALGYMSNNTVSCCRIIDSKYSCCKSSAAVLDKDGNCCESGILDACGVCDGKATSVDSHNECCSTIRDEKGICCKSGRLDECHVCDGDGSTCATTLSISVTGISRPTTTLWGSAPAGLLIQKIINYVSFQLNTSVASISVLRVEIGSLILDDAVSINVLEDHLVDNSIINGTVILLLNSSMVMKKFLHPGPLETNDPFDTSDLVEANISSIHHISRVGVCGNGVCEIGERCTPEGESATTNSTSCCLEDCPYVLVSCSIAKSNETHAKPFCSGHGVCFDTTGQCNCYEGYGGPDCSICLEGWSATKDGFCVKVPDLLTLKVFQLTLSSSHVEPSNTVGQPKKHLKKWTLILLSGCIASFIGVIVYLTIRVKNSTAAEPEPDDTMTETITVKPRWRTSLLGPPEDFDVIPISPRRRRSSIFSLEDLSNIELPRQGERRPSLPFLVPFQGERRSSVMSEEDLTEEEQSRILEARKTGILSRMTSFGNSASTPVIVADYFSESECDSVSTEEADLQDFMVVSHTV